MLPSKLKAILVLTSLLTLWTNPGSALGHENTDLVFSQRPEAYGLSLCQQPGLHCIAVQPGDSWENKFPNANQRDIVQRLNRTNIPLTYRHWLVVPNSWQNLNFMTLGPFAAAIA